MDDVPASILRGRRKIDGMEGVEILRDFQPSGVEGWFDARVRLTIDRESENVPTQSEWFLRVEDRYPHGECAFFPAAQGGIDATFPHQTANVDYGQEWREGRLCTDKPGFHLRGAALVDQPTDDGRMAWHCGRALAWLRAAVDGTLAVDGDWYEPPQFLVDDPEVVYIEDAASFEQWNTIAATSGTMNVARVARGLFALDNLTGRGSGTVRYPWGARVTTSEDAANGYWLRLPRPPILNVHAAPHTWGELRKAFARQNFDFDRLLSRILEEARGGRGVFLAIGAPIPALVGGPDVEMIWQCAVLPDVPAPARRNGFRSTPVGRYAFDRKHFFRNDERIRWVRTSNVAESHAKVRGAHSEMLRGMRVMLIGCGALGSQVAELLVRGGVVNLEIFDIESLEVGNLRRHTLTVDDVGDWKSVALAKRLNAVSLLANVTAHVARFPSPQAAEARERADIVIDCTGKDDVLWFLAESGPGAADRHYVSLSLSANAKSVFVYGGRGPNLDYTAFHAGYDVHLAGERDAFADADTRFVGCFNPLFPAPWLDICSRSAEAVRWLDAFVQGEDFAPRFLCLPA